MFAVLVSGRSRGRKPGVGGDKVSKNELNRIQGVEKKKKKGTRGSINSVRSWKP